MIYSRIQWILLLGLSHFGNMLHACDACGCSSGMNYIGIIPMVNNNLVGIRYQYQSFSHPLSSISSNGSDPVSQDVYRTAEIWGRYSAKKRIQLFYNLPYKQNTRIEEGNETNITGIGDIRIMANYNVLIRDIDSLDWKHFLRLGLHVSLPTGNYMQRDKNKVMMPLWFQAGTGSWGYGWQLFYTLRYKQLGFNLTFAQTGYTENELDYTPGSNMQASGMLFYMWKLGDIQVLPQAGLAYESYSQDVQYGNPIQLTGGRRLAGQAGIDLYLKRFLFSVFGNAPLVQDLPLEQPSANPSLGLSAVYFLK